ncbi:hypothetical protein niasHS_013584 [Heterodera schachtii]|uniref:Uncharacterized protein n=1 Tax=Heterodera schachtii TaxID=97005 RepID=A0ABD2IJD2_HETSC
MQKEEEWLKSIEQNFNFLNGKINENGQENKVSPKRKKDQNRETQQNHKFLKTVKEENIIGEGNSNKNEIEILPHDPGKIDRIIGDFAEFRLQRMELMNRIIRAQSQREKAELQTISDQTMANAKIMQFSLKKLSVFSAAKALDTALLGIEIAFCPFANVWHNAQGMANFVVQKFASLAFAILEMKKPAKDSIKETIKAIRKQFEESDKKHLTMAIEVVDQIENIISKILIFPRPDNLQNSEMLANLDFYINYFSQIMLICSPSAVAALTDSAPMFKKWHDKIQFFSFSLVNQFKGIAEKLRNGEKRGN